MALENNVALGIERLTPSVQKEYEDIERAVFDPAVTAGVAAESVTGAHEDDAVSANAGVSKRFATGTTLAVDATYDDLEQNRLRERTGSIDVQLTQALLRGRGRAVNLARVRQAVLDTELSHYEFRAVAENLVAAVETAYWDCVLAREKIDIFVKSLEVAEQQISEVREQINVGKVAELDLAAAEAEVAEKREQLIAARGDLAKRLLIFRQLINSGGNMWTRELTLTGQPRQPAVTLDDVDAHVTLGLRCRPDLAQARLLVKRGQLEVVRTRNGMLPQLDFFVRLGGTHYARSFAPLDEDEDWVASVGLTLQFPLGLREEKARHRIAALSLQQADLAVENMRQLVQYDVRSAYVDVGVAQEQIAATAATRKLREDTLTAEREKFRVGTSTTLLVAQAWRDLIESEINEVEAVISLRRTLITLYRVEGTLLERRGIVLAGAPDIDSGL
jgi:outer membrane protein TolC